MFNCVRFFECIAFTAAKQVRVILMDINRRHSAKDTEASSISNGVYGDRADSHNSEKHEPDLSYCGLFMASAIDEAIKAAVRASVPIGAVIVRNREIIAAAGNEVEKNGDPTAHAEMIAIRKACHSLGSPILEECDIYVTLEPCAMCAQAISFARIRRLYFGAYSMKYGAVEHGCRVFDHSLHKTEIIGGVCETRCAKMLLDFFEEKRKH
jgi:tRNA(adenine34) deaminase